MLKRKLASIVLMASFALLAAVPDASAYQRCRQGFRNGYARSYYAPRPYYRTGYVRSYYAPRSYYRPVYTRSYYEPRPYYRNGYARSYNAPRYYRERRNNRGRAILTIAAPAAIGAGVGALLGGGKGAGVGALLGGGGGAAYYLLKNRRHRRY